MPKSETGWASVPAGKLEAAKSKLLVALGDHGAKVIARLDEDGAYRQRVADFMVCEADKLALACHARALDILFTLVSDGRTAGQFISGIQAKGWKVGDCAKDVMSKAPFAKELTSGVTYRLVGIKGDEFSDQERTTKHIFAEATRRKYRKPPAFLAALLREKYTQDQLGFPYVAIMHEPICDCYGDPHFLGLYRPVDKEWLCTWSADPGDRWFRETLFVFLAPPA